MGEAKKWEIKDARNAHASEVEAIARELRLKPATAALLYNRGFTDAESAGRFLRKETELFHDPFMLTGMDKAVRRILAAVNAGEKIMIYGDYDVDGVTSVAALCLYLKGMGGAVDYYIPNRSGEGYGINAAAVDVFAAAGVTLMVTVDTGITAAAEIGYAKSLGMDVVVTDHHECHDGLPEAVAVVNPRNPDCPYPFKELAGVGVVFKLLCALEKASREAAGKPAGDYLRDICGGYADLVAVGTVADVMPLVDENRLIVSVGLSMIENSPRLGLAALLEQSGVTSDSKYQKARKRKITSSLIGYVIAPRINAAGRISCASKAVELFLTSSEFEARKIAAELCETNRERQSEENAIIEEAYRKITEEHDFENDLVIVLAEDGWHHGVIGIVSSRITEHFNLPSILISFEGDVGKGSGRSLKGLNLVEALKECGDCLVKFGGHELAAGMSIERGKLEQFKRRINDYARARLTKDDFIVTVPVDCELAADEVTLELACELYCLEPYGIANPVPVFILRDAEITEISPIGGNRHTRMTVAKDGAAMTAVYFGVSAADLAYGAGDIVDMVFNLDVNEFRDSRSAQLIVRDLDFCREYKENLAAQKRLYTELREGGRAPLGGAVVPSREDFVGVYLFIKCEVRQGREKINIHTIERHLGGKSNALYAKIRFIIDILNETGVISAEREPSGGENYNFKLNYIKNKINLDKSSIYKKLKSRQEKP